MSKANKRLERTRQNGSSIRSNLGEPLKRSVRRLSLLRELPEVNLMKGHRDPQRRLHSFQQSVIASRLLAKLGFAALANVPQSLPEPIRSDFRLKAQEHLEEVKTNGLPWQKVSDELWVATPRIQEEETGSANDIVALMLFSPEDQREHGLRQRLPLEQSVVMYFAHLDGFLQDLFEEACQRDNRVLISNKQVSFADVVLSTNWDNVIKKLIERLLLDLGFADLEGKIDLIEKTLHVDLSIPEGLVSNLKVAEQGRHAFVHTSGFVSPNIDERLKGKNYSVGDRFSVSLEYSQRVSDGILMFGGLVYDAIAAKFWPEQLSEFHQKII